MSERELIDALLSRAPSAAKGLRLGPGDDGALLEDADGNLRVLTTDCLVEAVHFESAWMPAEDLGFKAVAVNVSDLAAMGARPRYALLSLVGSPAAFGRRFAEGFGQACEQFGVTLVGGNVAASPGLCCVTVHMEGSIEAGSQPLLRSGGRAGDDLYVSGPLGLARWGLLALQRCVAKQHPAAVRAFLRPAPRVELGLALARLAKVDQVRGAMDISDGLAADLPRLCQASGLGARLRAAALPRSPEPCPEWLGDPTLNALIGGEDYELLVVAPPSARARLAALGLTRVGELGAAGEGVCFEGPDGRILDPGQGFDHFRAA